MGSRSERKQPGALVGEKSQTVFSANWKLDVMLLKNLQMLDVSKHRVSHRISMDQRVVNKRFQTKLYRSKITHARMTNNRELLKELIHGDNYTFNTSVGGQDDKYTVTVSPAPQKSPVDREESTPKETLNCANGKGVRPAATSIVIVEPNDNGLHGTAVVHGTHTGSANQTDTGSVRGSKLTRASSSASFARNALSRQLSLVTDVPHGQDLQVTLVENTGPKADKIHSDDHIADSNHKTREKVIPDDNADGIHGTAVVHGTDTGSANQTDTGSVRGSKLTRASSSASFARNALSRQLSLVTDVPHGQDLQVTLVENTVPKADKIHSDDHIADSNHKTRKKVIPDDKRKLRPNTAFTGSSKRTRAAQSNRPKTALARRDSRLLTAPPSPDVQISPSSSLSTSSLTPSAVQPPATATQRPTSATPHRRAASGRQQKHTMPSVFGEAKRPTLLDINRDRLVRAKFPDRVQHFATSCKSLQTDQDQTVDYYTHRLLENLRGGKGPREFIESDAERRDAQRTIGNLNAINMTFGNIERIEPRNNQARKSDGLAVTERSRAWGSDNDDDYDNLDNGDDNV